MIKREDELISEQPEASFTGKNLFPVGETRHLCPIHLKIGSGINIHIQPEHTSDMTPVSMATSWRLKTPWKCYLRCVQEHIGPSGPSCFICCWTQMLKLYYFNGSFSLFLQNSSQILNISIHTMPENGTLALICKQANCFP